MHARAPLLLVVLALALASNLRATAHDSPGEAPGRGEALPFETVAQGSYAPVGSIASGLVRSPADARAAGFARLLDREGTRWDREAYVVVRDLPRSTGGYTITVTAVEVHPGGRLVIEVETTSPRPTEMVSHAFSRPFHVVRLAAPVAGVRVVEWRRRAARAPDDAWDRRR